MPCIIPDTAAESVCLIKVESQGPLTVLCCRIPKIAHTAVQTDPVDQGSIAYEREDEEELEQSHVGGLDRLPTDAAVSKLHSRGVCFHCTSELYAALSKLHGRNVIVNVQYVALGPITCCIPRGFLTWSCFQFKRSACSVTSHCAKTCQCKGGVTTTKRKKKPRNLGGFAGMLTTDKSGRVRGPMWTTNTISQIYLDKTINVGFDRAATCGHQYHFTNLPGRDHRCRVWQSCYMWTTNTISNVGFGNAAACEIVHSELPFQIYFM
jgi:hypothetical protein